MENGISVLVPAYNAEATIGASLSSVIRQSQPADEIVVLDDGSTDRTADIASSFGPRVSVHRQRNAGVAMARNALLRLARHELVAFLDADDLWHPRYLERQRGAIARHPDAAVYYSRFQTVRATEDWTPDANATADERTVLVEPRAILTRYIKASGFLLPSFSIVRKSALFETLGEDPFPADVGTAEDVYMWYAMALVGPFVELTSTLGAYVLTSGSLSSNRLHMYQRRVAALEYMVKIYETKAPPDMKQLPVHALLFGYRQCAKHLMGVGNVAEARAALRTAWEMRRDWRTLAVYAGTLLPAVLQPAWPGIDRKPARPSRYGRPPRWRLKSPIF